MGVLGAVWCNPCLCPCRTCLSKWFMEMSLHGVGAKAPVLEDTGLIRMNN